MAGGGLPEGVYYKCGKKGDIIEAKNSRVSDPRILIRVCFGGFFEECGNTTTCSYYI